MYDALREARASRILTNLPVKCLFIHELPLRKLYVVVYSRVFEDLPRYRKISTEFVVSFLSGATPASKTRVIRNDMRVQHT